MDLNDLISNFAKKGLSAKEMVALSGNNIINRLMNLDLVLINAALIFQNHISSPAQPKKASSISGSTSALITLNAW